MKKVAVLIVLLLIVAGNACPAGESKVHKEIAILPFENSTGRDEYTPLEMGLVDIFTTRLSQNRNVSVVDREHLDKILDEYKVELKGISGEKKTLKVGKLLGADFVLTGGFVLLGDTFKIYAHLFDIETTQLVESEEESGSISELVELTDRLVGKLGRDLKIEISEITPGRLDRSPEANLHFMRGLGYYYSSMYDHANMEFMKTLKFAPARADARFWNGLSYYQQKEWAHAVIELQRFLEEFPRNGKVAEAKEMLEGCRANLQSEERKLSEIPDKDENLNSLEVSSADKSGQKR